MSTHNVTNEMEDGNFLSCVHKVYRRSYLYGSQLFLHQNRGAYLFFLFFGFSSSVHLFQLLVYNITVNLAPSAEGHQCMSSQLHRCICQYSIVSKVEFDLNCEATIYTTDGTPLQVCYPTRPHSETLTERTYVGITGGFCGNRRVEYIFPRYVVQPSLPRPFTTECSASLGMEITFRHPIWSSLLLPSLRRKYDYQHV